MRRFFCFILLFTLGAISATSYAGVLKTSDQAVTKPATMFTVSGTVRAVDSSEYIDFLLDMTWITFYPYDKITLKPGPIEAIVSTNPGLHIEDFGFPGRYRIALSDEYYYKVKASPRIMDNEKHPGDANAYEGQFYPMTADIAEAQLLRLDNDISDVNFTFPARTELNTYLACDVYNEDNSFLYAHVTAYRISSDSAGIYSIAAHTDNIPVHSAHPMPFFPEGNYILKATPLDTLYEEGYFSEENGSVASWEQATRIAVVDSQGVGGKIVLKRLKSVASGNGEVSGVISGRKNGSSSIEKMKGVRVYITDELMQTNYTTYTDENGSFSIRNIAEGKYKVFADKPGYTMQSYNYEAKKDGGGLVVDGIMNASSITSVKENEPLQLLKGEIYPNPATTDQAMVKFPARGKDATLRIVNILGQEVLKTAFKTTEGMNTYKLNIKDFPTGTYTVIISTGEEIIQMPSLHVLR